MNLYIFGPICDKMVNVSIRKIVETPPEDTTIVVYVNSEGGDRDCDTAIYEALRLSGKFIITYAVHQVYSAALTIYLAGDERYAQPHSSFMIHEVYHDIYSEKKTCEGYEKSIKELKNSTLEYYRLIAARTNLTILRIRNAVKKAPEGDWQLDTDAGLAAGIVTHIGLPVVPAVVNDDDQTWEYSLGPTEEAEEAEVSEVARLRK